MKIQERDRGALIIAAGIVLAGFLIAVALYLSRTNPGGTEREGPAPPPPRPPSVSVVPVSPVSPPDPSDQDARAQEALRQVLRAAQGIVAESGDYTTANSLALAQREPSLTYLPSIRESTRPDEISISFSRYSWAAAARSESGTCFWIKDTIDQTTNTTIATYGSGEPCSGRAAEAAIAQSWPGATGGS